MMAVANKDALRCGTASRASPTPPVTTQAQLVRNGPSRVISEAEKELRTALQLAPDDADAQNALAMLERAHEEQAK